jgi:hypothetical protein
VPSLHSDLLLLAAVAVPCTRDRARCRSGHTQVAASENGAAAVHGLTAPMPLSSAESPAVGAGARYGRFHGEAAWRRKRPAVFEGQAIRPVQHEVPQCCECRGSALRPAIKMIPAEVASASIACHLVNIESCMHLPVPGMCRSNEN